MGKKLGSIVSLVLGLSILFSYQNCAPLHEGDFATWNESSSTTLPPFPPSLASALSNSCASCHGATVSSPENFVLAMSLDNPWVNLDDPESSLVLMSVLKQAPAKGMPEGETEPWEFSEELRGWLQSLGEYDPGAPPPPVNLGPATFSSVNGIIQQYCISCHGVGDDHPLATYTQVMEFVEPPGGSSLGDFYETIADRSMPRPPVSMSDNARESVQELIFEWINSGAPNN